MTIPFTDLIQISNNQSIIRYTGANQSGQQFFAYIKCSPDTAKLMYRDYEANTSRNIAEYGEIIYRDFLSEPDEKAKAFLEQWLKKNSTQH
jgi:hypothetical protein